MGIIEAHSAGNNECVFAKELTKLQKHFAENRPNFAFALFFSAECASFVIICSASLARSTLFNMWEKFESKVCTPMWWFDIVLKDMLFFIGTLDAL